MSQKGDYRRHRFVGNSKATEKKNQERDDTATAFSENNRIGNAILETNKEDDNTDSSDKYYTISKSHCKPHLPTPESKRQKMRMTRRLTSLWLKLAIELSSQIEKQPLLSELCPRMTPPKIL